MEVIHIAVDVKEKAIDVPKDKAVFSKNGLKNNISAPLQKYIGIPINTIIAIPPNVFMY